MELRTFIGGFLSRFRMLRGSCRAAETSRATCGCQRESGSREATRPAPTQLARLLSVAAGLAVLIAPSAALAETTAHGSAAKATASAKKAPAKKAAGQGSSQKTAAKAATQKTSAQKTAATPKASPASSTAAAALEASGHEPFAHWLADFRSRALTSGRPASAVAAVLDGVAPIDKVIELDREQPEQVRPVWEYLDSAVSAERVTAGRQAATESAALFSDLEARYGVDAPYLQAIWGLETYYGNNIGSFDAAHALATLAWEGRRRDLFESELLAMMDIIASGQAARADFVSGWAGALGQTQFMPSKYRNYAVDYDGDGRKDIWRNRADALASAANYIAAQGWKHGEPWGIEVTLPEGFDLSAADGRRKSAGEWAADGVARADGQPWADPVQGLQAKLLVPAGAHGPAFLTFANFDVFRRYNTPTNYALAAGLLGDSLAGKPPLKAAWPRNERTLTVSETEELQRLLQALGYDTQGVDGLVGPNTRAALRAFQADRGMPADAFATATLLERARADAAAKQGVSPPPPG
jgi:membrane-bound lytic murein transglycosylase B